MAGTHDEPPQRHPLERFLALVLAAGGLAVVILMHVVPRLGGDDPGFANEVGRASETLVALWLPAACVLPLLALGVWWRHRRSVASWALIAVAASINGPELWGSLVAAASDPTAPDHHLRIAVVNLAAQNFDDPAMEATLEALDADVLVMVEVSPKWSYWLERWFDEDDYPHRILGGAESDPGFRLAIWSRLPPAGEAEVLLLEDVMPQVRVPLQWHGRTFMLHGIHPWAPMPQYNYPRAWRTRRAVLRWLESAPPDMPTVVAGDCNTPPRSAFLRRLEDRGFTSVSESVLGRAPATWPMNHSILRAPFRIAIDHVFVDAHFEPVGFSCGPESLSDHRAVAADLVWARHR